MKATILGRSHCKWCREARKLCKSKGVEYKYVDLDKGKNAEMKRFFELEKFQTVPQVWLDGEHVGGFADLREKLDS